MSKPNSLEQILEYCLEMMSQGATLDECLVIFPDHVVDLRPLLQAALQFKAIELPQPNAVQLHRMEMTIQKRLNNKGRTRQHIIQTRPLRYVAATAALMTLVFALIYFYQGRIQTQGLIAPIASHQVTALAQEPTTTPTLIPTDTVTPSLTPTITPRPTETHTTTPTATTTASATLTDTPQPTETVTPTHTPQPTATNTQQPSPTVTEPPSQTPTPSTTPTPTLSFEEEALVIPVYIDLIGQVEAIDNDTETLTVNGVQVQANAGMLDTITSDSYVIISGLLLDNAVIKADTIQSLNDAPTTDTILLSCETTPCDAVLQVLAAVFDVPYEELADLQAEGLTTGEIARVYLIADITQLPLEAIIAMRRIGATWQDFQEQFEASETLNDGFILGNGKGQTIRPIPQNMGVYHSQASESQGNQGQGQGNQGNQGQGQGNQGNQGQGQGNQGNQGQGQGNQGNQGQGQGNQGNQGQGQGNPNK